MQFLPRIFLFTLLAFPALLPARHIVGGDLTYTCLGPSGPGFSTYEIKLVLYRDCRPVENFPTNTPFDPEARIQFFDGATNASLNSRSLILTDSISLPLTSSDTCVQLPDDLCYLSATYSDLVRLPNNPNGYHLAWGRCCRNQTIVNLTEPGAYGAMFTAFIPNTALCNSSPVFTNDLPTYICQNSFFDFDHSATDPDGDSLVYRITTPFHAGDPLDPIPDPTPPPHQTVLFRHPFSLDDPMGGNPPLAIDARTGRIQTIPDRLGQFVFSVSVFEYRNGQLLGEVKRDIQINVIDCPINNPPRLELPIDSSVVEDTILFFRGEENCLDFRIEDRNGSGVIPDQLRLQVEGAIFGGGTLSPPYATVDLPQGPAPLDAQLCWAPSCGGTSPTLSSFVLQATDQNTCPGPNITRDTLWIRLLPPRALPPTLECVAVQGPNEIRLSWAPLPPEQQQGFLHYELERNDGTGWQPLAVLPQADLNSYLDGTALNANRHRYAYRLRTLRQCPEVIRSEASQEGTNLLLTATSISPTQTQLSWSPASTSEARYRLWAETPADVFVVAQDLADTTFLFDACSFEGQFYVEVVTGQTACNSRSNASERIVHENAPPTPSPLCQVSWQGQAVAFSWVATTTEDFQAYRLYRLQPRQAEALLAEIDRLPQTTYVDSSPVDAPGTCYVLEVWDACNQVVRSEPHCPVTLSLEEGEFEVGLAWSAYEGWSAVAGYELWEVSDSLQPRLLGSFGRDERGFLDQEVRENQGSYCYRVKAQGTGPGCEGESWSNLACATFRPSIFLPNAFTPNGDGINDEFRIQGLFVRTYHLQVFDRWGQLVFESRDPGIHWDGQNTRGQSVPEGVYLYRLRLEGFEGDRFERGGSITLIR